MGLSNQNSAVKFSIALLVLLPIRASISQNDGSDPTVRPSQDQRIESWIAQLNSPEFIKRQEASRKLWSLGAVSEAALRRVAENEKGESAERAALILRDFHLGIYPETDPETVSLIRRYHQSELAGKRFVTRQIYDAAEGAALVRLLASEPDIQLRQKLSNELFESPLFLQKWILKGRTDSASGISLDLFLRNEELGLSHQIASQYLDQYCWINLQTGRVDSELKKLAQRPTTDRMLEAKIRLNRSANRLESAIQLSRSVKETKPFSLFLETCLASAEWSILSDHFAAKLISQEPSEANLDQWVHAMLAHEFAGNLQRQQEAVQKWNRFGEDWIKSFRTTGEQPQVTPVLNRTAVQFCEAQLICGESNSGWKMMAELDRMRAVAGCLETGHYRQAFGFLGIDEVNEQGMEDFIGTIRSFPISNRNESALFISSLIPIAQAMHKLGFSKSAGEMYRSLFEHARKFKTNTSLMTSILRAILRQGNRDLFNELVARELSETNYAFALAAIDNHPIYLGENLLPDFWWNSIKQIRRIGPLERLKLVLDVIHPEFPHRLDPIKEQLLLDSESRLDLSPDDKFCLALTWLRYGHEDEARKRFQSIAGQTIHDSIVWTLLGDINRRQGNSSAAFTAYETAWAAQVEDRELLFNRTMRRSISPILLAETLPATGSLKANRFPAPTTTRALTLIDKSTINTASSLLDRGFKKESANLLQSILKSSTPFRWEAELARDFLTESNLPMSNVEKSNLAKQQLFHFVIDQRTRPVEELTAMIVRARRLEIEAMLEQDGISSETIGNKLRQVILNTAEYQPWQLRNCNDLRRRRDGKKIGDDIAAEIWKKHATLVEQFPNSAAFQASYARIISDFVETNLKIAAQPELDLENALKKAQFAVKSSPTNVEYLLTLGKIHHQLGHHELAQKLLTESSEREPPSRRIWDLSR